MSKRKQEVFNIHDNLIVNELPLKEKLISHCLISQPEEVQRILASKELEVSMYENLKV